MAALLASQGFTGIVDVFEAPYGGFCTTFSRSQDRFDLDELSAGLGERFETMRISLKFYSCVGSNHTTLDAIRDIRKRRPFTLDEIDSIVVHGSQVTVDHVGWPYQPEGLTAAQLNLPFCVATLLIEGDVFVDEFTPDCVDDDARIKLSRKVKVVHDPAITALGAAYRHKVRVEVHFRDGSVESETREAPRGSEQSFASADDIVGKFRKLTRGVMAAKQQDALIEAVMGLDELPDSRTLDRTAADRVASDMRHCGSSVSLNPGYSFRHRQKMEFGIFDHLDRTGTSLPDYYEDRLKIVEAYDRAGFYAYHLAEHHATPLGMAPSPNVFLAAVAQRTRRLRFGPMVFVLPLYHPLRLIEEICMLDQMSGGRLELSFGRGASPIEIEYFGVDPGERAGHLCRGRRT